MPIKLFILGLPGSGKSEVARHITRYIFEKYQWTTHRFNDYGILKTMSDRDTDKQFKPADVGGFDVLDLSAFDIALRRLEQVVNEDSEKAELVLIEFARNDYQRAFHQFSQAFFKDAYFLYLDAEVETCKQRIHDRTIHPIYEDDYPVSEYIFKEYYYGDDGRCLPFTLKNEYGIDEQQVLVVNNNFPSEEVIIWEGFIQSIYRFVDSVIDSPELSTVP